MSRLRVPLLALAAVSLSACAAKPATLKPTTDVIDAAPRAPVAEAPGSCRADADCPAGERCASGRCAGVDCSLPRVAFAFDSSQLDDRATRMLQESARCLSDRRATALLIEGHCDERGTSQYNVALGARRAEAVRRYLEDLGVTASLDSISFGKELPIAEGSGEPAWAQNRRAEMRLPGERRSDGQVVAGR